MSKLHFVGFNGYDQCPKNERHFPKVIADWTEVEGGEILNVSCAHKLLVVETKELFKIYGVLREDSQERMHAVTKPAEVVTFASCESYLIAAEGITIWKYTYKTSEWMRLIVSFTKKQEEGIWGEKGNRILKISFQHNLTDIFFLLSNGSVWKLSNKDKLTLIHPYDVEKAVDVVSGLEHSLILTESGCVLSWGNGSRGQLGNGDLDPVPYPLQVAALEGMAVTKIAAGGWHSCAVTDSGDLCIWGWNNYGQLSVFEREKEIGMSALPAFVDVGDELELSVVDVACGRRHTVAMLDNGDLFAAGWNGYSQLGLGTPAEKVTRFTKCTIQNSQKGKLVCGPWYTILLR